MKKSDWYGLSTSLGLHALLLIAFGLMNVAVTEPDPVGFIEVEFGPFSEGRQVQRVVQETPKVEEKVPDPEPEPEPEPEAAPPEVAKPVDLADQPEEVVDEEKVEETETEVIAPTVQNNPAKVIEPEPKPEPKPVRPLGGGNVDGTTGTPQGDTGESEQEKRTAPFQIEGLNRNMVYAPLPSFPEKVNADIRVRVKVDPQGNVIETFPLLKANARLEQAVRDALRRWRFNALPTNVPQEAQTGIITFRFRVE